MFRIRPWEENVKDKAILSVNTLKLSVTVVTKERHSTFINQVLDSGGQHWVLAPYTVEQYHKYLAATSIFYAPEGWHNKDLNTSGVTLPN